MVYEPGKLKVVAYKDGEVWAEEVAETAGEPAELKLEADRKQVSADRKDLIFVTVEVIDEEDLTVPAADNIIKFEVEGPAEIVATDNGDPTDMEAFPSHDRAAFNGKALVIVRPITGSPGNIIITARSSGLKPAQVVVKSE